MAKDVVKWEPMREVSRLSRDMDRMFEDFFAPRMGWAAKPWEEFLSAVDISESAEQVTVKAELPGIDPKEVQISLSGDVLTIKGERKSEREEKKEYCHLVERSFGSFSRSLLLPTGVNADKIEAKYERGF